MTKALEADDEEGVVLLFVQMVRHLDPDILIGWETNQASWGFLIQRAEGRFGKSCFLHPSRAHEV